MMNETFSARALNILNDWVKSESLRKHCYAVADSMKHFAQVRGEDADLWEAVGLLHDMDYERYPDRKSTRLNSSHPSISYAVFCLKKKKKKKKQHKICRIQLSIKTYTK